MNNESIKISNYIFDNEEITNLVSYAKHLKLTNAIIFNSTIRFTNFVNFANRTRRMRIQSG